MREMRETLRTKGFILPLEIIREADHYIYGGEAGQCCIACNASLVGRFFFRDLIPTERDNIENTDTFPERRRQRTHLKGNRGNTPTTPSKHRDDILCSSLTLCRDSDSTQWQRPVCSWLHKNSGGCTAEIPISRRAARTLQQVRGGGVVCRHQPWPQLQCSPARAYA